MITINKKHIAHGVVTFLNAICKTAIGEHPKLQTAYATGDRKLVATDSKRMLVVDQDTFKLDLQPGYYKILKSGSDWSLIPVQEDSKYPDYTRVVPKEFTCSISISMVEFSIFFCRLIHGFEAGELYLNVEYIQDYHKFSNSCEVKYTKYDYPVLLEQAGIQYVVMPMAKL